MKTVIAKRNISTGFTLIEMLGVIIIIAILAALIAPKVMQAIARSKISNTLIAYDSLKGALVDYYSRSNSIPLRSGTGTADTATATGRFDADLRDAGFLEKLVQVPIGNPATTGALTSRAHVRSLVAVSSGVVTAPTATTGGNNFDLDNNPATADFNQGEVIVTMVIPGVALLDAIQMNGLIDSVTNSGNSSDQTGRCLYSPPANGVVTVYIYVGHH